MNSENKSFNQVAEIIRSTGHPVRLKILLLLRNNPRKKMTVTEIHTQLGLTQPEVSRHLSILKNSTVLLCEKEGTHSFYHINQKLTFFDCLLNFLDKN